MICRAGSAMAVPRALRRVIGLRRRPSSRLCRRMSSGHLLSPEIGATTIAVARRADHATRLGRTLVASRRVRPMRFARSPGAVEREIVLGDDGRAMRGGGQPRPADCGVRPARRRVEGSGARLS